MVSLLKNLIFIFLIISCCCSQHGWTAAVEEENSPETEPLDGGFGTNITWWNLEEGLDECNRTTKPMMMIIHKTWCPACNTLKECFINSTLIQELSQFFTMINLMDQEVPDSEALAPDGHYFPRILFLTYDGQVVVDLQNPEAGKDYLYYYFTAKSVEVSMAKAIRLFYNIVEEKTNEL